MCVRVKQRGRRAAGGGRRKGGVLGDILLPGWATTRCIVVHDKRVVSGVAVGSYRDLRVWQVAMDLAVESYRLGELLPSRERFGLVAQIRRAATSIAANIAEGHGRLLRGEYRHHLSIARGSLKELETLLALSERLGYLSAEDLERSTELCDFLSRMLTRLRRSLRETSAARRPPPAAR